jgi:hypothetical protein
MGAEWIPGVRMCVLAGTPCPAEAFTSVPRRLVRAVRSRAIEPSVRRFASGRPMPVGSHPGVLAPESEGDRGVTLDPLWSEDHRLALPAAQRHLQRLQRRAGPQVRGHGPADDPAAPRVEGDRQVQEPSAGGETGRPGGTISSSSISKVRSSPASG